MALGTTGKSNEDFEAVTPTGETVWIDLRLTVESAYGSVGDFVVRCPDRITVGELSSELGIRLDRNSLRGGTTLRSERVGLLSAELPIGEVDLLSGDRVSIQQDSATQFGVSPHAEEVVGFELHVVGGPAAGSTLPLKSGVTTIGRDPSCELPVDDPSLSRRHFEVRVSTHTFEARDVGSTNGTRLEGDPLGTDFEAVEAGQTITAGRTMITLRHRRKGMDATRDVGAILFNRPPRVASTYRPPKLTIPSEPSEHERSPFQYGAMLIPLVLGGVMAYAMKQPIYLLFMLMSPLMMGSMWFSDRRKSKKGDRRDKARYKEELATFESDLERALGEEVKQRRAECPDVAELVSRARERTPDLWERRGKDSDFLLLDVGAGVQPSRVRIQEPGAVAIDRDASVESVETAAKVPLTIDLPELRMAGLYGDRRRVHAGVRWLIAQAVTLHDPSELAVVAIVNQQREWEWLKWAPHSNGQNLGLAQVAVSSVRETSNATIAALRALLEAREEDATGRIRSMGNDPRQFEGRWVLLVVEESADFDSSEMAKLLDELDSDGVCCVWIGSSERALPGNCGVTLGYRDAPAELTVTRVASGQVDEQVTPTGIEVDVVESVVRDLAPVRVVDKRDGSSGIPPSITFSDLHGIDRIAAGELADRWKQQPKGLRVTLGATSREPFEIDLETDGPHGLIAGTTGAGKSEFLQSLVVGLATNYSPERVSFLFVDYKGGAAFKDCIRLPHSAGMVTDLDEHLAKRVLASLHAEIRKREHHLRDLGAKDMAEVRKTNPREAMPSLLIVVDEFAALAGEVPEFVDGLVDIAQRGRSLGIHLLLATQKPGGVVSGNIRANTNLRIALRVNNDGESQDVIDANEAGRISRNTPGRGFARTGHSELTEFQTAYLGGMAPSGSGSGDDLTVVPFTLSDDEDSDFAVSDFTSIGGPTELAAFCDAFKRAASDLGLSPAEPPWLPPLPDFVSTEDLDQTARESDALVGIVDEPRSQSQYPLALDLSTTGNLLVYGTGGSGKTTFLRTLAAGLSATAPPSKLSIYGLDCGGRSLMDIEALPNVGSVVPGDDQERTRRLLTMLRSTIARRAELFGAAGVADIESYRLARPDAPDEPTMVLLLDSYAGFMDRYEMVDLGAVTDLVPRLLAEGPPVGVHVVATADRRSAFPMAVSSIVSERVVFQMASEDEDMSLGLPREFAKGPRRAPGRGILADDREFQAAAVGRDARKESQTAAIAELGQELSRKYGGEKAIAVGSLPTQIVLGELPPSTEQWHAVVGLDDATMQPATVSLDGSHFVVSGPYRSGRSEALKTLIKGLTASTPGMRIILVTPRRSPLSTLTGPDLETYGSLEAATPAIEEVIADLPGRNLESEPLLLVLDDATEISEGALATGLDTVLKNGLDSNVRVLAAFESQGIRTIFTPWIREIRKHKNGILLDPDHDLDGDIFGMRLPRAKSGKLPEGRGYLAVRGEPMLCQVAIDD